MAAHKGAKPAPARPGNGLRLNPCVAAWNSSDLTQNATVIQDRRAGWLARRFRLSLAMAAVVAEAAFSVGGAR
jgi:hypothetical protein